MTGDSTIAPRGAALRKHRVSHGLCPNCGKEAAPFYLCGDCRFRTKLVRVLNRLEAGGGIEKIGSGRHARWRMLDMAKCEATPILEAQEGDRRLEPRLGGKRVDVLETLVEVMERIGKPATIEEIYAAWGRLRENRRSSLASDMATIIAAQRKRDAKAAKRAAAAARSAGVHA